MSWLPDHEIEIVAGTPPGGGLDRAARALLAGLEAWGGLGVPARVHNVPGDGAKRCWVYMDGRQGDPHVVSISSVNLTTDHLLGAAPFRHDTDFTPLARLFTEYIAFLARPGTGLESAGDLLARFSADAGSVRVALATSLGNPNHIALAKAVQHAGGDPRAPRVRAFDSALDAVAEVVNRGADVAAVTAVSAAKELEAGRLRALAVTAPERLGGLYAQAPAWRELGVDCAIGSWRGLTGPRGLAPEHIEFWAHAVAAAVDTAEWRAALTRLYWTPTPLDGARLREFLARERESMTAVLRELGLLEGGRA